MEGSWVFHWHFLFPCPLLRDWCMGSLGDCSPSPAHPAASGQQSRQLIRRDIPGDRSDIYVGPEAFLCHLKTSSAPAKKFEWARWFSLLLVVPVFLSTPSLIAWNISNNTEDSLQRPPFEILPDEMNVCLLIQVQPPKFQVYSLVQRNLFCTQGWKCK